MTNNPLDRFASMTEFEISELFFIAKDSSSFDLSLFMTGLFAYLAVGHFVAKDITKVQAIALTTIYSVFCFFCLYGNWIAVGTALDITEYRLGTSSVAAEFVLPSLLMMAWLVSVIFMYQQKLRK